MKIKIVLIMTALITVLSSEAQDIRVAKFERNYTSLIARMHPQYDNSGEGCAVFRCFVRGKGYTIEPNLGVVKDSLAEGEIILWVPQGTKRLTVRHTGSRPLVGYEIPLRIETKTDYNVYIDSVKLPKHNVYIGAGYNVVSLSGPSVAIGANVNHHQIELGVCYGLNKTDDLFFYDSNGNVVGGYNYSAICANLSYGYEIAASDFFAITPMIGSSYLACVGNEVEGITKNSNYEKANSLSVTGSLRFTIAVSDRFKLCVTPGYQSAVYKNKTCKLVSEYDDTMKNWHTGFNLNVGFIYFF